MASSLSAIPQKRKGVSYTERALLRKQNKEHPSTQTELINWFLQETGHKLSQAQVSRTLSPQYYYIDNLDKRKDKVALQAQRSRVGNWTDLDSALFEWQQRLQKKKAVITGEILKAQAAKLWASLPQYEGKEAPKFSNGWLEGFQWRFNLREYVQHGEASSAAINTPDSQEQMQVVRDLSKEYGPKDTS